MDDEFKLADGGKYWLGACWGIYREDEDIFDLGNTWIGRWDTWFKNI